MIFITWNVNSITARRAHVEQLLDTYEPDILCIQETKIVDEKFPRDIFLERGYELEVYGEKSYNGVAIAAKQAIQDVCKGFEVEIAAGSKRLLACDVEGVKVINVYIPNGQAVGSDKYCYKLLWMAALQQHIKEQYQPDDRVVICGDFNVAPEDIDLYKPEQWDGAIMASPEERRSLNDIKEWGFVDLFRLHHSEAGLYTFWEYMRGSFRRNAGFRIDHIWASKTLAQQCTGVIIAREMRELERPSDHAPVIAEFDLGAC